MHLRIADAAPARAGRAPLQPRAEPVAKGTRARSVIARRRSERFSPATARWRDTLIDCTMSRQLARLPDVIQVAGPLLDRQLRARGQLGEGQDAMQRVVDRGPPKRDPGDRSHRSQLAASRAARRRGSRRGRAQRVPPCRRQGVGAGVEDARAVGRLDLAGAGRQRAAGANLLAVEERLVATLALRISGRATGDGGSGQVKPCRTRPGPTTATGSLIIPAHRRVQRWPTAPASACRPRSPEQAGRVLEPLAAGGYPAGTGARGSPGAARRRAAPRRPRQQRQRRPTASSGNARICASLTRAPARRRRRRR